MSSRVILVSVLILLYVLFLFWYGGNSKPLTSSEIDYYIDQIMQSHSKQNAKKNEILIQLRNMAKKDDGKSFYMVNLIKYREHNAENPKDNPMEARNRYSRNILPVLIRHGSHPVFSSSAITSFLKEGAEVDWDTVAIVRYRSMRDFLEVTTENSVKGIDVDKWMSIDKTQVFPVRASLSMFFVRLMVAVLLAGLGIAIHLLLIKLIYVNNRQA